MTSAAVEATEPGDAGDGAQAAGGSESEAGLPSARRVHRLVVLLTVLLAVDYADRAVLGAMAPTLKRVFSMSNTKYGVLSALFGLVAAVATLPAGALVDRVRRTRLLGASAAIWSIAMIATAAATSFTALLLSRLWLAVVAAAVGPAFPSIAGDVVPVSRRGSFLGRVESGQLVGGAVGVLVGGGAVATVGWRWGFLALAVPGVLLGRALLREPEPARRTVGGSASGLSLWRVARYLVEHRTAWLVLLAVTAANGFLAGVSAFAVIFAVGQYGVSSFTADMALLALGAGAVGGIVVGGRLSDGLMAAGRPVPRILICGVLSLLTSVIWLPVLITHSLLVALPFLVLGAFTLAATLPTLDAVRVEVVPGAVRGKAEAVRTLMRTIVEGGVPLLIGFASDRLGGGGAAGLRITFLVTLPALTIAGLLMLMAAPRYLADERAARAAE